MSSFAKVTFAIMAATGQSATIRNEAFLSNANGEAMRPDEVAKILVNVEDEWRKQAGEFLDSGATDAPGAFAKSCATVVTAVVQGSGGDRNVAKEYLNNVCNQKILEGWHKTRCTTLAASLTGHAMKADFYANREMLDSSKVCTGFWSEFVEMEKNREAEEAKVRAEEEKVRLEKEKKDKAAATELEAAAKAAEEKAKEAAKVEAELKAKEQSRRDKIESEKKAKVQAEEAKKRAAEAAEKLAKKKAEAELVAKEAQQKLEEAAKAEQEHKARLEEHQKAEKILHETSKALPAEEKPATAETNVEPKVEAKVETKDAPKKVEAAAPKPAAAAAKPAPVKADVAKAVKAVAPKAEPVKAAEKVPAAAKPEVATKKTALLEQDPCAGCDTGLAQAYQTCAMKHGNPCAETNAAGIVTSGPGQKKDISCCMKKEKHDRCLQCSSMDCAHKTCNVNKKYYNTYTMAEKFDDKKAMKKKGWGK